MKAAQRVVGLILASMSFLMGVGGLLMAATTKSLAERLLGIAGGSLFLTGALILLTQSRGIKMSTPKLGVVPVQDKQLPALIFHENLRSMKLMLVGSLTFVASGLVILLFYNEFAGNNPATAFVRSLQAIIVGVLSVVFFGLCAIAIYRRLRNQEGVLALTPNGLWFTYGTGRMFVHWQQVEAAFPYRIFTTTFVALVLSDTAQPPITTRLSRGLNQSIAGFDVGVPLMGDTEPVVMLIEFYRAHPELRDEIGSPRSLERYKEFST